MQRWAGAYLQGPDELHCQDSKIVIGSFRVQPAFLFTCVELKKTYLFRIIFADTNYYCARLFRIRNSVNCEKGAETFICTITRSDTYLAAYGRCIRTPAENG